MVEAKSTGSRDQKAVVEALRGLQIVESEDAAWSRPPAVRVIDCVLSLMRSYDRFVVPRLDRFQKSFPGVVTISDLKKAISSHRSPSEFMKEALDYRDASRARILGEVVAYLDGIVGATSAEKEIEALEAWANSANFAEYERTARIRGFGLAGFQYLRMLYGADTAKPDVWICRWVSRAVGRPVGAAEALRLLENAAQEVGVKVRDVDTTLWEAQARRV